MKLIFITFLSMFISTLANSNDLNSRENLIAAALDDYGKVSSAWALNERCQFVKEQEKTLFEKNISLITVALAQDLGGPQMVYMVQASVKKTLETPKYAGCTGEPKKIFNYGYNHSKNWSDQIRRIQSKK